MAISGSLFENPLKNGLYIKKSLLITLVFLSAWSIYANAADPVTTIFDVPDISDEQLYFVTNELPLGKVNEFYNTTISVKGGTAPFSWSILSSKTRGWSVFTSNGTFSIILQGIPNTSFSELIVVTVRDSGRPQQALNLISKAFWLTIVENSVECSVNTAGSGKITAVHSGGSSEYNPEMKSESQTYATMFPFNETVQLIAQPAEEWIFYQWKTNYPVLSQDDQSLEISAVKLGQITAVFIPKRSITVDLNQKLNTLKGIGVSAFGIEPILGNQAHSYPDYIKNEIINLIFQQAKVSCLKTAIYWDYPITESGGILNFNPEVHDTENYFMIKKLIESGFKNFFPGGFSAPGQWKQNGSEFGTLPWQYPLSKLIPGYEAFYARYLKDYVSSYLNKFGENIFMAIAVQEEPDHWSNQKPKTNYSPSELNKISVLLYNELKNAGIDLKVCGIESSSWQGGLPYIKEIKNDPAAKEAVQLVAGHGYLFMAQIFDQFMKIAKENNIEVWQTDFSYSSGTSGDDSIFETHDTALNLANKAIREIKGGVSLWFFWHMVHVSNMPTGNALLRIVDPNPGNGTWDDLYVQISPKYYTFAQLSRGIQKGAILVDSYLQSGQDCSGGGSDPVCNNFSYMACLDDTENNLLVFTVSNEQKDVPVRLNLGSVLLSGTSVQVITTTENEKLVDMSIKVSGNTINHVQPAKSMLTFKIKIKGTAGF